MRRLASAIASAGVVLAAASAPTVAQAATNVAPDQYFAGQVNGDAQNAVIKVACVLGATTGSLLSNQTVAVQLVAPPIATALGFTGNASEIDAELSYTIGTVSVIDKLTAFSTYDTPRKISTHLKVPCASTGQVAFVPVDGGSTAVGSEIRVTFANIAVGPPSA